MSFLVVAAIYLIILYNRFVNFEHGVSGMKLQLKRVQAQNMDFQDKIFRLIDASKLESVSSGRLIPEKNPTYFEVNQKWSYASRH